MPDSLSSKALRGTLWTSVSNWFLKGGSVISLLITLHYLSVYEYGLVQVVLSFFAVGVLFNLSAFHDVMVTEMGIARGEGPERLSGLFHSFLRAQSIFSFLLFLIFFFGAGLINHFAHAEASAYIRIVGFLFLLSPLREAVQLLLNVELRFYELAIYSVLEQVSRLITLTLALVFMHSTIAGVLWATIISQVVALIIFIPIFSKIYNPLRHVKREHVSVRNILLRHGKWALAVSYISNLNSNLRIWLTQFFLGTEAVGLYEVAANLFSHTRSLLPISEVVTPIIPQYIHIREKFSLIVNKALKYSLIGYIALGLVGAFVFPPIILLLFPKYATSIPLFRFMLLGLIPHALAIVLTPVFYSFREQRSLFFAYIRRIILTAIFIPVLVGYFGVTGLAIEFVLTAFIFAIDRYITARRFLPEMHISPKELIEYDEYDKVLTGRFRNWLKKFV